MSPLTISGYSTRSQESSEESYIGSISRSISMGGTDQQGDNANDQGNVETDPRIEETKTSIEFSSMQELMATICKVTGAKGTEDLKNLLECEVDEIGAKRTWSETSGSESEDDNSLAKRDAKKKREEDLKKRLAEEKRKEQERLLEEERQLVEKATKIALDAIQLLGGNGYINEYPTGRLLRDAKLYEIGAGTSEIRRMLIGRELFQKSM